jgi:hypothetical protein
MRVPLRLADSHTLVRNASVRHFHGRNASK